MSVEPDYNVRNYVSYLRRLSQSRFSQLTTRDGQDLATKQMVPNISLTLVSVCYCLRHVQTQQGTVNIAVRY